MPILVLLGRWFGRAAATGLLAALVAGMPLSPATATTPSNGPPTGYGRIWIYRFYEPYEEPGEARRPVQRPDRRHTRAGGSFYRNVAPGDYNVTVDFGGRDVNQFTTVAVAAGQQVYIQVQVSRYWDCGGGDGDRGGGWCRPPPDVRDPARRASTAAFPYAPRFLRRQLESTSGPSGLTAASSTGRFWGAPQHRTRRGQRRPR